VLALVFVMSALVTAPRVLYVGSFTGSLISVFHIGDDGQLTPTGTFQVGAGPTWVETFGGRLFTTNEISGAVADFNVDASSGSLTFISRQASRGGDPTFISIDKNGKFVLVANYDEKGNHGSVAVLPILANGSIGESVSFSQHTGQGPDKDRQEGPHAHQIILDSSNQYAFSADLGADKVYQYKFDTTTGQLVPNSVPYVASNPGDGPRHMAFHPSYKFAYLACELSSVVIAFKYDSATGTLTTFQRISTVPSPQPGNAPAEILVIPNGHFVYVTNRGHNSIAVFRIDQENGMLSPIQYQQIGGANPRGLILDEKLRRFLVMNQDSGTVIAHSVNYDTGLLEFQGILARNLTTPVTATIFGN